MKENDKHLDVLPIRVYEKPCPIKFESKCDCQGGLDWIVGLAEIAAKAEAILGREDANDDQ